jgi:hypothetical protein
MRRTLFAIFLSLAVHVAIVASAVAFVAWRGLELVPSARLSTIDIDVKELPLGRSRSDEPKDQGPPQPVHRRKVMRKPVSHAGVAVSPAPDGGVPDATADLGGNKGTSDAGNDAGGVRRRPGDLRNYGPENSRLTALLRLDRLRASSTKTNLAAAIDQLLVLLPDRRRLLDGTGLDLYRDFDALLIATPEPRNDKVTFLAVRHRLKDPVLRAALDRGASSTGHAIEWRMEGGRPVGVRRTAAAAPGQSAAFDLDDRILVLPQPFLAVMAPPVYAEQLLGPRSQKSAGTPGDAGSTDGGAADTTSPGKKRGRIAWRELVAHIDAEDSALPEDAVFMITAVNLIELPGPSPVVPGTRGAVDEEARPSGPYGPTPQTFTLVAGIEPAPYLELIGEFANESDARQWERAFPALKHRLLMNPALLLTGFGPMVDRAELSLEDRTLFLRVNTTAEELQRLLAMVTNLARSVVGRPR